MSAPVWRGGFRAFYHQGKLTMFGSSFYPDLSDSVWRASISSMDAYWIALDDGHAPQAEHTDSSARLVLLPFPVDGELDFRLSWEIRSKTQAPKGHWVSFVDAASGELIHSYNEVRFLEGHLAVEHDERTVGDDIILSDMSQIRIPMDPQSKYTNLDGSYEIENEPDSIVLLGLRTESRTKPAKIFL